MLEERREPVYSRNFNGPHKWRAVTIVKRYGSAITITFGKHTRTYKNTKK